MSDWWARTVKDVAEVVGPGPAVALIGVTAGAITMCTGLLYLLWRMR